MTKQIVVAILVAAISLSAIPIAAAVDVAPRISDREIIESLAELKQGNQSLDKRFDEMNQNVNQRFSGTNQRIDDLTQSVDQRFDDLIQSINIRFDSIDQRFDDINQRFFSIDQRFMAIEQRFDGLQNLIVALFGSVMALIIMLIGYMIWDRKTAQQPMKARLTALEEQVTQKLDPIDTDHSILTRLLAVQRKLAKDDPNLAELMRGEALL